MTRVRKLSELSGQKPARARRKHNRGRGERRSQSRATGPSFMTRLLRFAAVLAVGSLGLGLWNLRVGTVALRGIRLTPASEVQAAAAGILGERWVAAPTSTAVRLLESQGWIEHASARRQLFGRVEINVDEHQALFRCTSQPGRVVTCCGTLVDAPPSLQLDSLPLMSGNLDNETEQARLHEVLRGLESNRWPFRRALAEVRLSGDRGVEFVLEDGTEIWMGESQIASRLQWLAADPARWQRADVNRIDLRFDRQVVVARDTRVGQGSGR